MSTSDDILLIERRGHVLWLTINRPERRNALSNPLIARLTEAFESAARDQSLRAIVLTGSGDKAFCSGMDLDPNSETFGYVEGEPSSKYANLLRAMRQTLAPVVARVDGYCLAGGMGLLAVCDMAVASSRARFGLPEVKIGLFPMQVAALLQDMVPPRIFAEMCYTGEMLEADAALTAGLVNYVAAPEDLDAKLDWLVSRITDKSPTANRRGKYALNAISGMSVDQAMAHMEGQIGLMQQTEDAREGLAAFAEKRAPNWTGK